jgi:SAM-dependent methyltransferase
VRETPRNPHFLIQINGASTASRYFGVMTETAPAHGLERNATWYASWFDSTYYHSLYAHRDHAEAAAFVDALTMRLGLKAGVDLLDLGCGAGRHARQLAGHGMNVTGLDLSASSIRHATRYQGRTLSFRRHDMRAPFGYQAFECVCSFFTSFGYFEDAADHLAVIRNVRRALRPGGHFVLDYLNVAYADQHLVPEETRQVDGIIYRIARWGRLAAILQAHFGGRSPDARAGRVSGAGRLLHTA